MYKFKVEKLNEVKDKFKLNFIANEIGITTTYLSRIVNGKVSCKKVVAYCLTKMIDNEKEVDYFFDRI